LRDVAIGTLVLLATAMLSTSGCKKKEQPASSTTVTAADKTKGEAGGKGESDLVKAASQTKAGQQIAQLVDKAKQVQGALEDKAPPLTEKRYEELILELAKCKFDGTSIDWKCEQYKDLQKARQSKSSLIGDLFAVSAKLGLKLMSHQSPQVRFYAVGLMGSGWVGGTKEEYVDAVIKASETEKDPMVVWKMIDTISSNQRKKDDAKVGPWVLKHLNHENEEVRGKAAWALATWGKTTKGAAEAIAKVIAEDKSMNVRTRACEGAGDLEDDALIGTLKKHMSPTTDPALYQACFKGLVKMWTKYVFAPEKPSQNAYKLTLAMLKAKPRSNDRPPWSVLSYLTGVHSSGSSYDKWKAAATWYKHEDLIGALSSVIADFNANSNMRTYAVDFISKLGAKREVFEKLRKAYNGKEKEGSNSWIVGKLDQRLAALKQGS
jgi:hypothetical protein